MRIGVPREIKTEEYRVGLTPSSVREIVHHGHQVVVETNAGLGANFDDEDYQAIGAEIAPDAAAVFADTEMIVKVKEPQAEEFPLLREGQVLFTYLHLAAAWDVAEALVSAGSIGIAYETVTDDHGGRSSGNPGGRALSGTGIRRARCSARWRARGRGC